MKNFKKTNSFLLFSTIMTLAFGIASLNAKEGIPPGPGDDPLNWCPDGTIKCARSTDGTKVWHKGNTSEVM